MSVVYCSRLRCFRTGTEHGERGEPLCRPHLRGQEQRKRNEERRKEESERRIRAYRASDRRREFIRSWREAHPDISYTRPYECELCGLQVQSRLIDAGTHAIFPPYDALRAHHDEHGEDWKMLTRDWSADDGSNG